MTPLPTVEAPGTLAPAPPAPDTQGRSTPSATRWIVAAIGTAVVSFLAALKRSAAPA